GANMLGGGANRLVGLVNRPLGPKTEASRPFAKVGEAPNRPIKLATSPEREAENTASITAALRTEEELPATRGFTVTVDGSATAPRNFMVTPVAALLRLTPTWTNSLDCRTTFRPSAGVNRFPGVPRLTRSVRLVPGARPREKKSTRSVPLPVKRSITAFCP